MKWSLRRQVRDIYLAAEAGSRDEQIAQKALELAQAGVEEDDDTLSDAVYALGLGSNLYTYNDAEED